MISKTLPYGFKFFQFLFRCELEDIRMPFNNGNDKTTKHPVIVHSRRSNRQPSVQLALKCPKGKPCRLNASDSDVSTDYGSITNLLGHDVSYKKHSI